MAGVGVLRVVERSLQRFLTINCGPRHVCFASEAHGRVLRVLQTHLSGGRCCGSSVVGRSLQRFFAARATRPRLLRERRPAAVLPVVERPEPSPM